MSQIFEATATPAAKTRIHRFRRDELRHLFDAVNRTLADERALKAHRRLLVYRDGVDYTGQLQIERDTGWFNPMLHDLLKAGASVVVNEIGLSPLVSRAVQRVTGLPSEWITQQNLYITPQEIPGFAPHCDAHIVVVAHLHGRKEWFLYEKALEDPVVTNTGEDVFAWPQGEPLSAAERVTVEAGECFVIPRGRFHSARALTPGSVHLAIGVVGVRPLDYLWRVAGSALGDAAMRADLNPEEALSRARDYMANCALAPLSLPRNPYTVSPRKEGEPYPEALSFEEALRALPGA